MPDGPIGVRLRSHANGSGAQRRPARRFVAGVVQDVAGGQVRSVTPWYGYVMPR
jgi:hypothetical protein